MEIKRSEYINIRIKNGFKIEQFPNRPTEMKPTVQTLDQSTEEVYVTNKLDGGITDVKKNNILTIFD